MIYFILQKSVSKDNDVMWHKLFDFVVAMRTVMHYFFLIEAIRSTILIFIAIMLPCILMTQNKKSQNVDNTIIIMMNVAERFIIFII